MEGKSSNSEGGPTKEGTDEIDTDLDKLLDGNLF